MADLGILMEDFTAISQLCFVKERSLITVGIESV